MDDEASILTVSKIILERDGFEVVGCEDAESMLAEFCAARAEGRPFRAVLLDLNLPDGRGGVEVLPELKAIDPGVRAIAASGSTHCDEMDDFSKFGFVGALTKPFRMDQFAAEIHRICSQ